MENKKLYWLSLGWKHCRGGVASCENKNTFIVNSQSVRSELEIVSINTGLSLLGEFYQQLSVIKTICYLDTTHTTIQGNVGLLCYTIVIQERCQAWIPNPFLSILCWRKSGLITLLYDYKRFICINGKLHYTFHPGFPGLGWDISSLVKTRCIISCRIYIPQ